MKVKLRNKTFNVRYLKRDIPVDGEIGQIDQIININNSAAPVDLLETEIHEALHACLPDSSEDAVTDAAADITRFLWRRGYRRPNSKK